MKAYPPVAVVLARLVIFISLTGFCICSHAQPSSWNAVFYSPVQVTSMAYGNGTFVGCGGGFRFVSYDGSSWTAYENAPIINQGGVAYGNGMFLAFGTNTQNKANYILQSTNVTTWTTIYTSSNTLFAAAYGNNTWVFIGTNDIVTANVTFTNWSWSEFQPSFSPACITYGNGLFVIGGYLSHFYSFYSSSDGISWQYKSTLPTQFNNYLNYYLPFTGIAFGNGVFVATALYWNGGNGNGNQRVFVSSDLVNWISSLNFSNYCQIPIGSYFPVAFGGNQFVTGSPNWLGYPGNIFSSLDGYGWVGGVFMAEPASCFAYGQGAFVAADALGDIYQSNVFSTQSNLPPTALTISAYAGVIINGTAGAAYQIQYSTDLNSWETLTNFTLPHSPYLWVDTSTAINSGQRFYRSVQLQ